MDDVVQRVARATLIERYDYMSVAEEILGDNLFGSKLIMRLSAEARAEARAATTELFDWLANQSQDKVVLNWLAAMRKEALGEDAPTA